MTYSVKLSKNAEKFLDNLQKNIALRILNKLEEIKDNPFHYLEHYEGEGYKLRIGDYRALIDVDFEKKILFVRVIDKRGRIYKR
ncbi:type II toxin-antitoxin system RelE/ParE family toxin [Candidatus Pacearchaeota archaeon]|nr:type II toxin-antitoxin system RelE/ParE family toxin [Candidatus Pacearchaeota archaeon]